METHENLEEHLINDDSDSASNLERLIDDKGAHHDNVSVHSKLSHYTKPSLIHDFEFQLDEEISNINLAKNLMSNTFIAALGVVYYYIHDTANIVVLGKFNEAAVVGAFGLSTFYINIVGLAIGVGFMGGIDLLCSSAFGASKFKLVAKHFLIARVSIILFFIFAIIPLCFVSYYILHFIGIEEEICYIASKFCKYWLASMFFNLQFLAIISYLASMNIFKPGMFISLSTAIFYPYLCNYLTFTLNLKEAGVAMASGIYNFTIFVLAEIYINYYHPYPQTMYSFSFSTVYKLMKSKHILIHLKIGIPSAIVFLTEWSGIEFSGLLISFLDKESMAANTCFVSFINNIEVLNLGYNMAIVNAVGNSLGFGSKKMIFRNVNMMISLSIGKVLY